VGTGPEGRIVAEDVEAAAASGGAPAPAYKSDKLIATPEAKKLAKSKGIKLETLTGTGNFGRITADDVRLAAGLPTKASLTEAPAPPVAAPAAKADAPAAKKESAAAPAKQSGVTPMNGMQKAVVKNMEWANDVPT